MLLAYLSYPYKNHISRELVVSSSPVAATVTDLEDKFRKTNMTHPPPPSVNLVDYRDIRRGKGGSFEFNMSAGDVMVFLHIQKTGGTTFGKHLVQDIDLEEPCRCENVPHAPWINCHCLRPGGSGEMWLFSRYSSGWKCGVHADWTELISCVNRYLDSTKGRSERRYFYVTFLRDPVLRFLSELKHVQRGATWKDANNFCNGRPPSTEELPDCYESQDWRHVGINEFMACDSNLAINRKVSISLISYVTIRWLRIFLRK